MLPCPERSKCRTRIYRDVSARWNNTSHGLLRERPFPDGQRVAADSATYAYNDAGDLVSAATSSGTASYTYDGAGLRASATVNGVTTEFTYDPESDELLVSGGTAYIYGPDGLPVEQINGSVSDW
jgi:YD repeat-containing protein